MSGVSSSRPRRQATPAGAAGNVFKTATTAPSATLSSTVGHWYLFLGVIFACVALLMPKGIVGYLLDIADRRARRAARSAAAEDAA